MRHAYGLVLATIALATFVFGTAVIFCAEDKPAEQSAPKVEPTPAGPLAEATIVINADATWGDKAMAIMTLTGQPINRDQTDVVLAAFWLANAERDATDNEQRAEAFCKLVGAWINQQVERGAAKAGVMSFQQQLQAANKPRKNDQ